MKGHMHCTNTAQTQTLNKHNTKADKQSRKQAQEQQRREAPIPDYCSALAAASLSSTWPVKKTTAPGCGKLPSARCQARII